LTRIDTAVELEYYRHGGILQYVLRELLHDAAPGAAPDAAPDAMSDAELSLAAAPETMVSAAIPAAADAVPSNGN